MRINGEFSRVGILSRILLVIGLLVTSSTGVRAQSSSGSNCDPTASSYCACEGNYSGINAGSLVVAGLIDRSEEACTIKTNRHEFLGQAYMVSALVINMAELKIASGSVAELPPVSMRALPSAGLEPFAILFPFTKNMWGATKVSTPPASAPQIKATMIQRAGNFIDYANKILQSFPPGNLPGQHCGAAIGWTAGILNANDCAGNQYQSTFYDLGNTNVPQNGC